MEWIRTWLIKLEFRDPCKSHVLFIHQFQHFITIRKFTTTSIFKYNSIIKHKD